MLLTKVIVSGLCEWEGDFILSKGVGGFGFGSSDFEFCGKRNY